MIITFKIIISLFSEMSILISGIFYFFIHTILGKIKLMCLRFCMVPAHRNVAGGVPCHPTDVLLHICFSMKIR